MKTAIYLDARILLCAAIFVEQRKTLFKAKVALLALFVIACIGHFICLAAVCY